MWSISKWEQTVERRIQRSNDFELKINKSDDSTPKSLTLPYFSPWSVTQISQWLKGGRTIHSSHLRLDWLDTDVTLTWKSWSHSSLVRILPSRLSYGGLTLCLPHFNALTTVVSSGTTMSLPSSEYSYLLFDFTVEMKTVENVLLFRWAYPCPPLFTCPRLWKRGHYVYGTIKEGSCWRHDTGHPPKKLKVWKT